MPEALLSSELASYQMFIDGKWLDGANGTFTSLDPYRGEAWASVPEAGETDVERAVAAARAALDGPWGEMTGAQRARLLLALADILERDAAELGAIESRDNGKLLREMAGQTAYIAEWYRYFAGLADKHHGEALPTDKPNFFAYTRHEPVGVVAAIVPWNSPLLLLTWKLAPGLAAGCTFVIKPSEHTPVSALELARRVAEAGFPAGVVNVLTASGPQPSKTLVAHPNVAKVAFTGSTPVGIEVGRSALSHMGRVLLELGGKSAQVVLPGADLSAAANGVIAGVFAAGGQTCMAGSRLVVHETLADELIERVAARARQIVLGDPASASTQMGPLANAAQLARVRSLVDGALVAGARAVCGGDQPAMGGLFFEPTVLDDVPADAEVLREEVFGPVLVVQRARDEEHAVGLANETRFGLAASVWTKDIHVAHRVAHRLRAGTVYINSYRAVSPDVPFGGMGFSGMGRESGVGAMAEFTETKSIWVETSGETRDPFVLA